MNILKNKYVISLGLVAVLVIFLISNTPILKNDRETVSSSSNQKEVQSPQINTFSYRGKTGVDALTLLREKAEMSLDKSGMVSSINGRVSNSSEHEYWAFYINGKLANVGPADYNTKDNDQIKWRIEKY